MTTKIVGNITKTVTQIIVAQRVAAGMSVTAPVIGLIASSVSLAISPLSFYNVAKKFEYADEILKVADKFKKYGYSGDELLLISKRNMVLLRRPQPLHRHTLGAVSAGVGARCCWLVSCRTCISYSRRCCRGYHCYRGF